MVIYRYFDIIDGTGYTYIEKSEGPITDVWGTPYFIE